MFETALYKLTISPEETNIVICAFMIIEDAFTPRDLYVFHIV